MKSYILILIRICIVNFIGVLLVVVYFTNRQAIANSSKTPPHSSSPIAYISAEVTASAQASVESSTPEESPSGSSLPTTTVRITATQKPRVSASAAATTAVTTVPATATVAPTSTAAQTNTPAPTQTQAPTPTPTPTPQPTATPAPTPKTDPLLARVAPHNTQNDCWMIIDQKIYNVSDYMTLHPGGKDPLLKYCGKDGTVGYHTQDKNPPVEHSSSSNQMLELFLVQ